MNKSAISSVFRTVLGVACMSAVFAHSGTAGAADRPIAVVIEGGQKSRPVSRYEYGMFIEPIGQLVARTLWSEMLDDRKFFFPFADPKAVAAATPANTARPFAQLRSWNRIGTADDVAMDEGHAYVGKQSVRINLNTSSPSGIAQSGIGLAKGRAYTGHVVVDAPAGSRISIALVTGDGAAGRQEIVLAPSATGWQSLPFSFTAGADSENARFELTATGTGALHIGTVSLMPADNIDGWRADTTAIAKSLHSGFWRLPGGNFLSDWDWHAAIGPRDTREPMFDHAWDAMQTNDIGMDEWLNLTKLIGTEPYITVNAGLGDANSAAEEVEYINGAASTYWGAKRAANGHPEPYGVKLWNIGNEPYGAWQIGVTQLKYYVIKHKEFTAAMLKADPSITLIASGGMPDQGKGHGEKINMTPAVAETRYGTEEDWTGGLLAGAPGTFQGITEHWYDTGEQRPAAPAADELLEYVRSPSNHVRMKAVEWEHYRKTFPEIDKRDIFLSIDEYAYMGSRTNRSSLRTTLAYSMIFQEMLRHTDFLRMTAHTTGTSTMDITPTSARLNALGTVFKLYGDLFGEGAVPLAVSGDAPQPDPKYVVGFNHPKVNAGSPTWPLDVIAALSPDGKSLRIGVVNATTSPQTLALDLRGLKISGKGQRWTLAGTSVDAPASGAKPEDLVTRQDTVPPLGKTLAVTPVSTVVYEFPLAR